jgi:hypothetical protein
VRRLGLLLLAACSSSSGEPEPDGSIRPFPDAPAGVRVPVLRADGTSFAEPASGGSRPRRELAGVLAGADLVWDASADVFVTGDVTVSPDDTLSITGTHVVLGEQVRIIVGGELVATGALFSSTSSWGQLHLLGARAELVDSWFLAGGDDPSRVFGHSGSQPVIFADGGTLSMRGGGVLDSPGKAMASHDATVDLTDVTIARCDTGGEHDQSVLTASGLQISDMRGEDDNDGIYLHLGRATIRDSRFARGDDDGIDHNGAELTVERTTIDDFAHEGVAASNAGSVVLTDVTIRGCAQGVEAGYGSPAVALDHVTLEGNGVGVRFGDDYDMACTGHIDVDRSIVRGNDIDVRNFVPALGGPLEDAIAITCSQIGETPACDADVGARP